MNDSAQTIQQPANVSVEQRLESLTPSDLNDLCDATEAAIENGGGFGWVKVPARDSMERYWQGVIAAPTRWLFIARLDGVICGTTQVVLPPSNNEAQGHTVTLTTNFIAPWARGHGLSKMLLEKVEATCRERGFAVINLDVRETMDAAIALYESMGYQKFGEHPHSVRANGQTIKSLYYYKVINPEFFG